jgi:hypothetical protein
MVAEIETEGESVSVRRQRSESGERAECVGEREATFVRGGVFSMMMCLGCLIHVFPFGTLR